MSRSLSPRSYDVNAMQWQIQDIPEKNDMINNCHLSINDKKEHEHADDPPPPLSSSTHDANLTNRWKTRLAWCCNCCINPRVSSVLLYGESMTIQGKKTRNFSKKVVLNGKKSTKKARKDLKLIFI